MLRRYGLLPMAKRYIVNDLRKYKDGERDFQPYLRKSAKAQSPTRVLQWSCGWRRSHLFFLSKMAWDLSKHWAALCGQHFERDAKEHWLVERGHALHFDSFCCKKDKTRPVERPDDKEFAEPSYPCRWWNEFLPTQSGGPRGLVRSNIANGFWLVLWRRGGRRTVAGLYHWQRAVSCQCPGTKR